MFGRLGVAGGLYFDGFNLGDLFRSPSRTLGDAHFLLFSGLTGDNHPLHHDEESAYQRRFGLSPLGWIVCENSRCNPRRPGWWSGDARPVPHGGE